MSLQLKVKEESKTLALTNLCNKSDYENMVILERALRALASSSGGAACPGGTRGQPRGSTPGSGSDSKAI